MDVRIDQDKMWIKTMPRPATFAHEVIEVPSEVGDGYAVVRTMAGGICGSDLELFRNATPHRFYQAEVPFDGGFPLHEIVGEVVATGTDALSIGDTVVGWAAESKGLVEYAYVRGDWVCKVELDLPASSVVLVQPLACVLYAVERLGDVEGLDCVVVGQGAIGLLFSHLLKSRGARSVTGVDRVDRSAEAAALGIDNFVLASCEAWSEGLADADRPDVIVEAVGHQVSTLNECLGALKMGGRMYYFGVPDSRYYAIDMEAMLRMHLHLMSGTTRDNRRVLQEAQAYLTEHPELFDVLITDVFEFDDIQAAFERAARPAEGHIKVVLEVPASV